jgi:hypothetical protein
MKVFFLILLNTVLFYTCSMEKLSTYIYADGSGNVYTIAPKYIEYNPVSPEKSSSGIYSGGEYVKKAITLKDYNRIKESIGKAVSNKAIYIENRMMGSGLITIRENEKQKTVIFKSGCKEQTAIEDILQEIIKKQ